MIEPVLEELAKSKSRANGEVGFAKMELSISVRARGSLRPEMEFFPYLRSL